MPEQTKFMKTPAKVFDVLRRPRITEKASRLSEMRVYCFDVHPDANKALVSRAVKELYNVTPKKVTFSKVPSKSVGARKGRPGKTAQGKKAFVFLKAGDTIQFV